jgi:hypothetical protein
VSRKKLILSVGLNKTGTTSIQRTCAANVDLLRSAGVAYPMAKVQGRPESNHTRLMNGLFRREPNKEGLRRQLTAHPPVKPGSQEVLRENFRTAITGADRLLVVAQGISLFDLEELQDMKAWFADNGWDTRVVCGVRHMDTWTHSMVDQFVTGVLRQTIAEAVSDFVAFGSLVRTRIENIRTVFPDAEFYSFERALAHPRGVVGDFFERIGVPSDDVAVATANTGRCDAVTRVMSTINERYGGFVDGQPNPRGLGKRASTVLAVAGPRFRLLESEGGALHPMVESERQWLGEELGPDFVGGPLKFAAAPAEAPAELAAALATLPPKVQAWARRAAHG